MHTSQSHISRLGVSILGFLILSIAACTPSGQLSSSSSNPSPVTSPEAEPVNPTAPSSADDTSNSTAIDKFTAILGTQSDGWLPKVLAEKGLKKGLPSDAVGKIFSGAEEVSDYGFSKVAVNNVPGLKEYEFYYVRDSSNTLKLESVKLHFDPALNQAYADLVKVLSDKYGDVKPEDVEQQMIVWVGPDFVTAQLTKQVTDFGGYELNVSLQE